MTSFLMPLLRSIPGRARSWLRASRCGPAHLRHPLPGVPAISLQRDTVPQNVLLEVHEPAGKLITCTRHCRFLAAIEGTKS
jgi:hypothetical protein